MVVIQEREIDILASLLRYRYLHTSQVKKHFFATQTKANMHRVVKKLSDMGLIEKLSFPKTKNLPFGYLLFLTDKGAKILAQNFEIPLNEIGYKRITKPLKTVSRFYHRKRMIDFWMKLDNELAPEKEVHEKLEITHFITDTEKEKRKDTFVAKTHIRIDTKTSIIPDIIFKLRNKKRDIEGLFFVEIDTGTETIGGRFLTKKPNTILDKFERYKTLCDKGSKTWANVAKTHSQFRVLLVTETPKHIQNIQRKIKGAIPSDYLPLYLFSTHDIIEKRGVLSDKSWLDMGGRLRGIL